MPSLRDRSHHAVNWRRMGGAAAVLVGLGLMVWLSVQAHHHFIAMPRLLGMRHDDPVGRTGMATTQVTGLGGEAVPTLMDDLKPGTSPRNRSKSLELLSGIDDPRVVPALAAALKDGDMGVRLAAVAGLARTGDKRAASHLWDMSEHADAMLRQRAIVGLGLVVDAEGSKKLLTQVGESTGQDQILFAWAAGFALRRLELTERFAMVPPGPEYDTPAEAAELQAKVDEVHAAIRAGTDLEENVRKLSELTTVSFTTWDYAHQIGYQTLAVRGPSVVRGLARMDKPMKPQPLLKGLQLGTRPE